MYFKNIFLTAALSLAASLSHASGLQIGQEWVIDPAESEVRFQSIKNQTVVESSTFEHVTGSISNDGSVNVEVALDSINTGIDLRNVRMRFLFFETFRYPTAEIRTVLDDEMILKILTNPRAELTMPVTLDLHGVESEVVGEILVDKVTDSRVVVTSRIPISVAVSDFELMGGLQKLKNAAGVDIIPSATVTFSFVFLRSDVEEIENNNFEAPEISQSDKITATAQANKELPPSTERTVLASSVAVSREDFINEPSGLLSDEACIGRFEILSATGNIFFAPSSAVLNDESSALLEEVVDIVSRCPDHSLVIAGHTDSFGPDEFNQNLSVARAQSVVDYLTAQGIPETQVEATGYGETRPIASNATSEGRQQNRRIEFLTDS